MKSAAKSSPESSPFSVHSDSQCVSSIGIPHSPSITIGNGVSLASSLLNAILVNRFGSVEIVSNLGGHGGGGSGLVYRTRTRRSSLLVIINISI